MLAHHYFAQRQQGSLLKQRPSRVSLLCPHVVPKASSSVSLKRSARVFLIVFSAFITRSCFSCLSLDKQPLTVLGRLGSGHLRSPTLFTAYGVRWLVRKRSQVTQ